MDTFDYNVKGVKSFLGRDGEVLLTFSLYRGKVKIAFVIDDGRYHYDWFNWAEEKILMDYCESLPKEAVYDDMEVVVDSDMLVGALMDKYEFSRLCRLCKNSTLFRLKGDEKGSYRVYKKIPYNEAMKKLLLEKYGDTVEEILNEKY